MGCVNSEGQFDHWFANIHLSGPCNRSCYFCIGQHMMALDPLNNLDEWPLKNIEKFMEKCLIAGIKEINLTGSNTDPLLYKHHDKLVGYIRHHIPHCKIGIRTNGVMATKRPEVWKLYDKASISLTSFTPEIYKKTMGRGSPPDLSAIMAMDPLKPIKINVVLCPETVKGGDLIITLITLRDTYGITRVNLREPYGQPHIGCPLPDWQKHGMFLGMPYYVWNNMMITYWDVHYVEVESINLYANGIVSDTYPVTKGHSQLGSVIPQDQWIESGRVNEQWKNYE